MKHRLKVSELIDEVRRLGQQYPDTVYQKHDGMFCLYTVGETESGCGCIVGQAISNLRPELTADLAKCDEEVFSDNGSDTFDVNDIICELQIERDIDSHKIFVAQTLQDMGKTWKEAIENV